MHVARAGHHARDAGTRPSGVGADLRATLTALGPGAGVVGGVALTGLTLPGLAIVIETVLLLPRGILVCSTVDLPGPVLRLDAPVDGPWLADGWRLAAIGAYPAGTAMAAANAVAGRLESPGAPDLPVTAVVAVGPYVRTVVQPDADKARGLRVLYPSAKEIWKVATERSTAARPCSATAAAKLSAVLAPDLPISHATFLAEGFAPSPSPS